MENAVLLSPNLGAASKALWLTLRTLHQHRRGIAIASVLRVQLQCSQAALECAVRELETAGLVGLIRGGIGEPDEIEQNEINGDVMEWLFAQPERMAS